jgi:hypothetical protein
VRGRLWTRCRACAGCRATARHLCARRGRVTEEVAVCCSLAGDIAAGIARHRVLAPSREEIACYLSRARSCTGGGYDSCTIAKVLLVSDPDATDGELSARWLNYWRQAAALFDHVSMRAALGRLAATLRERRRMTGAEIAQVIDANTLRQVNESLLSPSSAPAE